MKRYLPVIFALFFVPLPGVAQTGLPPFGSLDQIGLEVRNNQDLNVLLAIPVVSSPGRGLPLNFSIVYNSSIWTNTGTWTPNSNNAAWGWTTTYSTGSANYRTTTSHVRCNRCFLGDGCQYIDTTTTNYYKYIDPVGTVHSFSGVYWQDSYNECTSVETISGTFTGYAADGSGYYITIDSGGGSINSVVSSGGLTVYPVLTDTNGNYISSSTNGSETDWTDSAGRVALKIITGTSSIQYKVLDPTGAYQTTTLNLQTLNVKTNFGCAGITEYTGTATLPQNLVLPNNQTYTFSYEPTPQNSGYYTGRLQKITLPTGGYHEYDYTGSNDGINCTDGTVLGMNRVVNDGAGNSATWNYVRNTSNLTTTITTPKLADTPNANDMVVTFNSSGQEISRKIYANSPGTTLLRTINTTWAANGTPATRITILEDGSTQSEVATTYDSNGLLDSVSEYGFGTGAPGGLFRTTTYTYQTSTNYTNLNILDLVTSKQIKDGSGTVQYRQDTAYDATSGDNQNCPTGVPHHNDGYSCSFYYRGNPTSVTTYLTPGTPANGITKNFTYDWFGNLLTAQVNCCQNKSWAYSATTSYSLPDSVTSGSSPSLTTNFTYNSSTGQTTKITNSNNVAANFSYDVLRRPAQVSQTNGSTNGANTSFSYDDTHFTSTVTTSVDSTKSVQQITALDTLGRPVLSTTEDLNSNVISKVGAQFDFAGRAYQTSNPYTGSSTTYWTVTQFDVLGRPTSITAPAPDSSATTISYSLNTTTATDPAGKQRKTVNDAVGRLLTVYEPDPTNNNTLTLQTNYAYSVLDELTTVTPVQGSQTRSYSYDALGRLLSATTPEAGRVCFGSVTGSTCNADGYDSFDNLQKRTDARGVLTSYGYDTLNRVISVSYNVSGATGVPSTPTVNFTYGNDSSCNSAHGAGCIGKLITMTDGVGSENYTYNNLEQLTQLQKVINGTAYTTGYQYNLASELTQITYPSGRVVQQSVDPIGRLCEIAPSTTGCGTASSPYATGYAYNAAGLPTGFKYGNGLYASFGFSSDRLQLNCLDYSTTNRNGSCAHDSTTKFGLSYSYPAAPGNNGLFSSISDSVDSGRSATYTYDALYRLITASTTGSTNYPVWGLKWTYDRYGNATAETQTAGSPPQYSLSVSAATNHITGSPYAYDLAGNMTNDGSNTLVYDAESRAVSATVTGSSSGTYTYDGNGLRVQKVSVIGTNSTTTVYIFSGSKVIAEYDNGALVGSASREYIYSGAVLLAKIDSSGTKYYHRDHLSNRYVTDSSGNKAAEMGHFPFGESWYNGSSDKLLFTTYERDSESGNDYAQARYNVNRLGRFSSPDPIAGSTSDPQSLNRYSYVRNMPVMLTDPSGMLTTCNTVKNPTDDQSASSDSDGVGMLPNEETDPAEPQASCGGRTPPCEYTIAGCGGTLDGVDIASLPPGILGSGASINGYIGGPGGWGLVPIFGYSWVTETDGPAGEDEYTAGDWEYGLLGYSFIFTGLAGDPQGPGGGAGPAFSVNLKRLNDCLEKYYKMSLQSFMPSSQGSNGNFRGKDALGNVISVENDVGSYSKAAITVITWGVDAYSFTSGVYPFSANKNYTANNLLSIGGTVEMFQELQIHELAHSLDMLTSGTPFSSEFSANKFENCVFPGSVDPWK